MPQAVALFAELSAALSATEEAHPRVSRLSPFEDEPGSSTNGSAYALSSSMCTDEDIRSGIWECEVERYLLLVGSPLLLLMGTAGNAVTLAVMISSGLRFGPTSCYLEALAASDTLTLWLGLGRHFYKRLTWVDIRLVSPAACQLQRFFLYSSMDCSAWFLVGLTVDRFIAVCYPLKKSSFTMTKAKVAILVTVMCCCSFNAHVFWTRGLQVIPAGQPNDSVKIENCGYPGPGAQHFWTYTQGWLAMLKYSLLPSSLMLAMNISIIKSLRSRGDRLSSRAGSDHTPGEKRPLATRTSVPKLTAMLLASTMFFLCIGAPAYIYNSCEMLVYQSVDDPRHKGKLEIIDAVVTLLNYVNHAANFYLYSAIGLGFRQEVTRLVCKRRIGYRFSEVRRSSSSKFKISVPLL